jgi:hypothetical protein
MNEFRLADARRTLATRGPCRWLRRSSHRAIAISDCGDDGLSAAFSTVHSAGQSRPRIAAHFFIRVAPAVKVSCLFRSPPAGCCAACVASCAQHVRTFLNQPICMPSGKFYGQFPKVYVIIGCGREAMAALHMVSCLQARGMPW